jgi:hypothetical protein
LVCSASAVRQLARRPPAASLASPPSAARAPDTPLGMAVECSDTASPYFGHILRFSAILHAKNVFFHGFSKIAPG